MLSWKVILNLGDRAWDPRLTHRSMTPDQSPLERMLYPSSQTMISGFLGSPKNRLWRLRSHLYFMTLRMRNAFTLLFMPRPVSASVKRVCPEATAPGVRVVADGGAANLCGRSSRFVTARGFCSALHHLERPSSFRISGI